MEGLPAPPPDLQLEQSSNSLFKLLQEADPNLSVPHLSQIEGLSLEAPSLHAFDAQPQHQQGSNSIISALNLGTPMRQPQDRGANNDQPSHFNFLPQAKQRGPPVGSSVATTTTNNRSNSNSSSSSRSRNKRTQQRPSQQQQRPCDSQTV